MPSATFDPSFLLFVPGDRPDRFRSAVTSGASAAILDLEDGVAAQRKPFARDATAAFLDDQAASPSVVVRINAPGTPWFDEDLRMLRTRDAACVLIPKVSGAAALDAVAAVLPEANFLALIESAKGLLNAAEVAAHPRCVALVFGPLDLAADLGGSADWDSMLPHRSHLLVAARAHRKVAIDGPTIVYADPSKTEADARVAVRMGFDGKLLIHPSQLAPARAAFRPSEPEIAHAIRVVEAAKRTVPAVLDGMMIDAPLLLSAERVLRRAKATAAA